MFAPEALRQIIRTTLQLITTTRHPFWTPSAEEMLLMIAAHESGLGSSLKQIGSGPALGLYQIEPATMYDNYQNFIYARPGLEKQITEVSGVRLPSEQQLQYNPIYSTIQARLKLYRSPGQLPAPHDAQAMANYAKQHYNSPDGAATEEKYMQDYFRLVLV